jgi:lipoprotein-releasing system permease protein
MYEFRTALSYLIPRKGQFSVSVVGLIAVLVIQAITWLILVFFSTTEGFETRWSEKIISVVGPMRIVPTPAYFDSPYALLSQYSSQSNFAPERLSTQPSSLPYDPSSDPPLPPVLNTWYQAHHNTPNPIEAITKELSSNQFPWRFFESTVCHLSIPTLESSPDHSLNQYTCLLGLDALNTKAFAPVSELSTPEAEHLISLLKAADQKTVVPLKSLSVAIRQLDIVLSQDSTLLSSPIPRGTRLSATLSFPQDLPYITFHFPNGTSDTIPLQSAPDFSIISVALSHAPLALPPSGTLPFIPSLGYPTVLPKQMRQQGARILDKGTFQFAGAGMGGAQTLTLPFYIAGFFDSGILPIGGKVVITSRPAVIAIQPDLAPDGPIASSGIIIDVPKSSSLESVQKKIQSQIDTIAPGLFSVQRYDQYEVTSELFQQLASEHTLFHLISIIIIIVACSNIFSMLFILAHDRRHEIAVLRALGAPQRSIVTIFIFAGLGVGLFGSTLGTALAAITLHYLPELLFFLSSLQGHEVLSQGIYGEITSQSVSLSTLLFTFATITITSALAGALAAIRSCRMNVSLALRS